MQVKIANLLILLVIFTLSLFGYCYFSSEPLTIGQLFNLKSSTVTSKAEYTSDVIILVDMGSTGTRMYAYNIKKLKDLPANSIPEITEIAFSKSTDKKAIANYCSQSQKVGEHIQPLYTELAEKLAKLNIDINETPIYFLATAGMRLYSKPQQAAVYKELTKVIKQFGHNSKLMAKTIPGELEGIFDWLSVNYKLETIQTNTPTVAALDMGGASTQVAMEYNKHKYNDHIHAKNIYTISLYNNNYEIFSKSILGYGLTQTKHRIHDYNNKQNYCNLSNAKYDQDYSHDLNLPTHPAHLPHMHDEGKDFDFTNCRQIIKAYLRHQKEHLQIAKVIKHAVSDNMKFIAFSGYYYKFNFFNSKTPNDFITAIPESCHMHRSEFKKKFPDITEDELNESCFDATYLQILLSEAYNIPGEYENFIIPQDDIDWTIGAALFISTQQQWID